MRKLFASFVFALALQTLAFAQCPDPNITADGFHPPSDSLECAQQGMAFNEFIQANIPATISTPLGAVTVTSIVVNDIQGMPSGITYSCSPSNCTFTGPSTGCINFSGTTNDPIGVYPLSFTVTVSIVAPILGARVFGPENLDTLIASLPFQIPLLSNIVYDLKVTTSGGPCPPPQPISVSIGGTGTICEGQSTTLTATVTDGIGGETFLWSEGSTTNSITVSPTTATTYSVTVTGATTATDDFAVSVDTLPEASFTLSDAAMPTITFDNTSTGATSYTWDYGDDSTATGLEPTYTYTENGTFTVQLIATNACGNDTASTSVTIAGVFIGSLNDDLKFSVYPNPNEGIFTITLSDNSGKPTTIRVFDQSGKSVFEEKFSGNVQKQMDLSGLPKGVYTLHLNSEKSNGVQKLVLR